MSSRTIRMFVVVGWVFLAVSSAAAQPKATTGPVGKEVKAVSVANTKDQAESGAVRRAVTRAAEQFLKSQAKAPNFVLLRDTIVARSDELVKSHTVSWARKEQDDELWTVQVAAIVDVDGFKARWSKLAELLGRTGPPQVLVHVVQKVDGKGVEVSSVQKRIESQLTKEGCVVVTGGALPVVHIERMTKNLAKAQGAHLLVVGTASAESGGATQAAGRTFQSYKATASVKLFRVDTGELLCSITIKPTTGIKPTAAAAAKQAMWLAAKNMGIKVRSEVLARWADVLASPTTQPAPATQPAKRIRTRRGE